MATFIKDCAFYFCTKTLCLISLGFLKPLKLLICLSTDISINHVIDLPKCFHNSKTYKHIFSIVDHLTKIRHFIFIISLDIEELVKTFIYIIYKLHSALNTI